MASPIHPGSTANFHRARRRSKSATWLNRASSICFCKSSFSMFLSAKRVSDDSEPFPPAGTSTATKSTLILRKFTNRTRAWTSTSFTAFRISYWGTSKTIWTNRTAASFSTSCWRSRKKTSVWTSSSRSLRSIVRQHCIVTLSCRSICTRW